MFKKFRLQEEEIVLPEGFHRYESAHICMKASVPFKFTFMTIVTNYCVTNFISAQTFRIPFSIKQFWLYQYRENATSST